MSRMSVAVIGQRGGEQKRLPARVLQTPHFNRRKGCVTDDHS